jgi:hypothetical protein
MTNELDPFTYKQVSNVWEALQEVTGQHGTGNEGFYLHSSFALVYGDDMDELVTQQHYDKAARQTGYTADFIEEIALDYYDGGRTWNDLRD